MAVPRVKPNLFSSFSALIDKDGYPIDAANPLPVNIGSATMNVNVTNAYLEVQSEANPDTAGEAADSVIIAGTTDSLFPPVGPNATAKPVRIGQGTSAQSVSVVVASDATAIPVSVATLPLPTGASTEATLSAINGKLASLGQKTGAGSVPVVIASDNTVAVSASSLPLPTGASTSALQTTGNASLSSIDGKFGTLGQKAMAGSAPVVIASDQSTLPVSAASLPLPTGAATSAAQTTLGSQTSKLNDGTNTAAVKAASTAAIATDSALVVAISPNNTVAVSATSLPLPTNAATSALQTTGNTSVGSIDTKTPALGQALAASSVPVVLTAAQITTLTPLSSVTVAGSKTNNSAAPNTNNLGTLPAVANASAPTYTEANQVALSVDLTGAVRTVQASNQFNQLEAIRNSQQWETWLTNMQLQSQIAALSNGFFPLEIPAFLG